MASSSGHSLSFERLSALLEYDPSTGNFTNRDGRLSAEAGKIAGGPQRDGYWRLSIGNRRYLAHRVAWFYVHGKWPEKYIDHINGVRTDNRIVNLREASVTQNSRNQKRRSDNTSGFKGVSKQTLSDNWMAYINVHGKHLHLGTFKTKDKAHEAYKNAAFKYHGDFARVE